MNRITETVKHLIIINVLFFVAILAIGPTQMNDLFAIHFPLNPQFRYWQVITHMFMHSHVFIPHILLNMLVLWMFGSPLEQIWGRNKFLFFYFSAGLGAVLLPWAIDFYQFNSILDSLQTAGFNKDEILRTLSEGKFHTGWGDVLGQDRLIQLQTIFFQAGLGASGCTMGLMAAYGLTFPEHRLMLIFLPIPIKAKYFIPLILAYETISGITGGTSMLGVNVAHFAHVGGMVTGVLIAWYWKKNSFNNRRWDR